MSKAAENTLIATHRRRVHELDALNRKRALTDSESDELVRIFRWAARRGRKSQLL